VNCEPPKLDIYSFVGVFKLESTANESYRESLGLQNTIWANTYLASGRIIGLVIFTGQETRSQMNCKPPT